MKNDSENLIDRLTRHNFKKKNSEKPKEREISKLLNCFSQNILENCSLVFNDDDVVK